MPHLQKALVDIQLCDVVPQKGQKGFPCLHCIVLLVPAYMMIEGLLSCYSSRSI